MELKEDDIIMCTVKSIEGTTVFLEIENGGEGSMVMSEVAAGRIRNLREYVYPNKKVVCKVLKILPENIQLSLRRVTAKEREEIQDRYKKDRNMQNLLKKNIQNPDQVIEKIKEKYELWSLFDKIKEDSSILEKFMKKSEADIIAKIISEKEGREKEVKHLFILKSYSEKGLSEIKEILSMKDCQIKYLGSSQFSISCIAKDFKEAEHKVYSALKVIESKAREKKALFDIKEMK